MGNRRSSIQLEQEQKSRHQLAERLIDFGWHCTSPSPDLGEDFIVDIYHDGQNTGVNFYIQEKSVTNLASRKTKGDYLVYPLKVKDLKHWKSFSLPVALVIWDVILREGRWCLVKDMISYLDQNNPKWRKNKSDVQVYVPWKNDTSDEGLQRLKGEIGKQVYPLISFEKDLSISMKLAFPKTPDGINLRKAFDLHIKEGKPITIKGDVVQELKFSDWWEAWFGNFDTKKVEIHLGEKSRTQPVYISLKIIPTNGQTVSLPNMEFKLIRAGTELIKFSNEHTSCPFLFTFSMQKREEGISHGNLTFIVRHVGGDPHEIMSFLDFAKAMERGGKLRIDFQEISQSISTDFPPTTPRTIDAEFYNLVQKLCIVQDSIGFFLKIPDEGISKKDAMVIHDLYEIIKNGVINYADMVMTLDLKTEGLKILLDLHKQGKPIHLTLSLPEHYIELFGEKINTGPMTRDTTGYVEMSAEKLEEALQTLSPEDSLEIKLINTNGFEIFSDWHATNL